MSEFVYILSTYDDYGAEDVTATLDRNKLIGMVRQNWPLTLEKEVYSHKSKKRVPISYEQELWQKERYIEWVEKAEKNLEYHLSKSDEELSRGNGHDCHDGLGGIQLHVIKLV